MERTITQMGGSLPTYAVQIELWKEKLDALCTRHSIVLPELTIDFAEVVGENRSDCRKSGCCLR